LNKYFYIIFLLLPQLLFGQKDTIEFSSFHVTLDSVTITATKKGFDVSDFIQMVREDNSFYLAFRNIRTLSYSSKNDFQMFNKRGKEKASFKSTIEQTSDGRCRTMKTLYKEIKGNFYKRKKYRYYTAKMFDRLFLTHGKVCEKEKSEEEKGLVENQKLKGMSKHINELKKLIFYPGEKADVPFIGKKTAIFEKKMAKYYNFKIKSKEYKSGIDCYVFIAQVKPNVSPTKTVIKYMETYFDKSTFQVVARNYFLKHSGFTFDFDVKMKIKLKKIKEKYVPEFIEYDGQWDVPARRPEIAKFSLSFYDYE